MNTPILFLVFNRPEHAARLMEAIRKAKPRRLFIAADGPRAHKEGERDLCERTRQAVLGRIDWECEVQTLFREQNLGCKVAVSSAISWFFEHVEEGIILEDDTLPSESFFPFCAELLERYRHDTRVGMVAGVNFQRGRARDSHSYYFSCFTHIWGWATWRRAWKQYDPAIPSWGEFRDARRLEELFGDEAISRYWTDAFNRVQRGEIDTWDYQWTYTCWSQGMLCILPKVNMVSNIGFGPEATHTTTNSPLAAMQAHEIGFPLSHPPFVVVDTVLDAFAHADVFGIKVGEGTRAKMALLERKAQPAPDTAIIELQDLMNRGIDALNARNHTAALELFMRAEEMQMVVQNLHYAKAICLLNLQRPAEARLALQQELNQFPQSEAVRNLLAQLNG